MNRAVRYYIGDVATQERILRKQLSGANPSRRDNALRKMKNRVARHFGMQCKYHPVHGRKS